MEVYLIITMAAVTAFLRFLPFIVWNGKRKTPEIIMFLGKVLPYSIMAMLVVYCLKEVKVTDAPFALPEIIASLVVIFLHLWKRNTLVSIVIGTLVYMALIQFVF